MFMRSKDVWSGGLSGLTDGRAAFCHVYAINAEHRTYSIKTYGSDELTANGDYTNVQVLSAYSSPLGDESSCLALPGSQGLCIFHGGIPWIVGFYNPVTLDADSPIHDQERDGVDPAGGSAAQNKERLNPGDQVFRTAGRCRLVLRRGGEVEIEATKLCKRTLFPTQNLINEICQNYEFRTDGGTIDWIHPDPDSDDTLCVQEWRDDLKRSNIVLDEKGSIEDDSDLIHRFSIGPGVPQTEVGYAPYIPVFLRETFNTGETHFRINNTAYDEWIFEDGEYTLGINNYSYFKNIKPTGQLVVNVANKFQMEILPTGEVIVDVGISAAAKPKTKPSGGAGKFHLNIKPSGETTIDLNKKISIALKADGTLSLDAGPGKATITVNASGQVDIKTTGAINAESPEVNLKAGKVKLGKSASDVVPMGKLVLKMINKFIQTFNAHNHQHAGLAGITSPPLLTTMSIGQDVLSQTVEVQS